MTTTLGTLPHGELTAPRRERAPAASRTLRGVVDGVSLAVAVTVLALLQRTPGVVILGTLSAVVAFLALRGSTGRGWDAGPRCGPSSSPWSA